MDNGLILDAARHWWVLALRGLFAVLFGIAAFAWPGITLAALVLLFGIYALADGISAIVFSVRSRWWTLLALGILSVLAGIAVFAWPGITALALLLVIAAWAMITGILQVGAAVRLRHEISDEWLLALSGILSFLFGAMLVAFPGAGILTLIWLIGGYAVIYGILMIAAAFRLRSYAHERLRPRMV